MATAARVHIAEAGTDPPRYRMVAFGGAGPVHAYALARLLNIREVIFPRGAGVASAIGMLVAPRSVEFTRSLVASLAGLDWDAVAAIVAELDGPRPGRPARGRRHRRRDRPPSSRRHALRRPGLRSQRSDRRRAMSARDAAALRDAFDARYRERFARSLGTLAVEAVSWRVRVMAAPCGRTEIRFQDAAQAGDALTGHRAACFVEGGGFVATPVYARARLRPGAEITGPALIEETEIHRRHRPRRDRHRGPVRQPDHAPRTHRARSR